eukprot:Sspe_Gene.104156::Locus_80073_Transcript_6_6_Confidence_0.364_Length_1515::g.104156::m.104156/K08794/CAMK1; calcium/calmodulin-dependent protein kinase I
MDGFNIGGMLEETAPQAAVGLRDIHDYYNIDYDEPPLGKGSFGVVRRARRRGVVYAVKCIDKRRLSSGSLHAVQSEVEVQQQLNHFNIVKVFDSFESADFVYIVMECMEGGPLLNAIEKAVQYSESTVRRIARSLFTAIEYLHSKGVVHRDIKPANLLLLRPGELGEIKVTDFGFARLIGGDAYLRSATGTHAFMAPEVTAGDLYGKGVDIWSSGVILFLLLSGTMPFRGPTGAKLTEAIQGAKYSFSAKAWDGVSNEAKDLIAKCLTVDPEERLSAADALLHPWLQNTRLDMHLTDTHDEMHLSEEQEEKIWSTELAVKAPVEGTTMKALVCALKANPKLKYLRLCGAGLSDDAAVQLCHAAADHPSLELLDLSSNPSLSIPAGKACLKLSRCNPKVRTKLHGTRVPPDMIQQIQHPPRRRPSTTLPALSGTATDTTFRPRRTSVSASGSRPRPRRQSDGIGPPIARRDR